MYANIKIKQYIESNYSEKITLDEISNIVDKNKFQMIKEFKRTYHITPYQYLLQVRAGKAKQMIQQNISLSEVAVLCGFSDQSNMTKNFKKFYSYTPSSVKRDPELKQAG